MMLDNLDLFPSNIRVLTKSEPMFRALVIPTRRYATGHHDTLPLITQVAQDMARTLRHDYLLMSNEDILGSLPSRFLYDSLYGDAPAYLPVIQSAFRNVGHDVQFVFYVREYSDWLHSLYRYHYQHEPDRPFAPKRFKQRRNLPDNWNALHLQLTNALGTDGITFINYEADRTNGRLGTALFKMCGMTDADLDALNWIEPVNVSRPATIDPKNW
jgi:hypothetical protein